LIHILEWKKEKALKLCQETPCLWEFEVEKSFQALSIDLGIKSQRALRPAITLEFLRNTRRFKVLFLTTRENGEPIIDLSLCSQKCDGFKNWKDKARVFRKKGKRVFKLPSIVFTDEKLVRFCSTCQKELKKRLENELSRKAL